MKRTVATATIVALAVAFVLSILLLVAGVINISQGMLRISGDLLMIGSGKTLAGITAASCSMLLLIGALDWVDSTRKA